MVQNIDRKYQIISLKKIPYLINFAEGLAHSVENSVSKARFQNKAIFPLYELQSMKCRVLLLSEECTERYLEK